MWAPQHTEETGTRGRKIHFCMLTACSQLSVLTGLVVKGETTELSIHLSYKYMTSPATKDLQTPAEN